MTEANVVTQFNDEDERPDALTLCSRVQDRMISTQVLCLTMLYNVELYHTASYRIISYLIILYRIMPQSNLAGCTAIQFVVLYLAVLNKL